MATGERDDTPNCEFIVGSFKRDEMGEVGVNPLIQFNEIRQ